MNKLLMCLVSFLIATFSVFAQEESVEECATITSLDPYFDWEDYERFKTNFLLEKNRQDLIEIPVVIRIVNITQGGGGLDRAYIPEIIDSLNARFASTNLQFFQCQDPVDVYENKFYDFDRSRFGDSLASRNIPNVLNIYFINKVLDDDEFLCGYARFPWIEDEYVVVAYSCAINGSTVAHEVGHFLGLLHTHETARGIELADGSNCKFRGDEICDTPADPRLGTRNVDANCNYTGNERDINNDPYNPDPTNLMSYSRKSCRDNFTEEQAAWMNYYLERDYGHLVYNNVTDTEEPYFGGLKVYPNPSRTNLFVEFTHHKVERTDIRLIDMLGKTHQQTNWVFRAGFNRLRLQVEDLPSGIYILEVSSRGKRLTRRVLVQ